MITPRRTRLVRVPDLHGFRRAIVSCACSHDIALARSTAVLVPTASAAAQLRDTLETVVLLDARDARGVAVWPDLVSRDGWYARMHAASAGRPRLLTAIEREVLMGRAAREAIGEGRVPPFRLRPALVAEMLAFLDTMLRLGRTIDAFERLFVDELDSRSSIDRGAERLLRQTHFLVAAFRRYRDLVVASGCLDEQLLREALLQDQFAQAYTRLVVTVGDRACSAHGLWPVDFDLLARLPRVSQVDVIATEQVLASGFHERLQAALPGFEEVDFGHPAALAGRVPTLIAPAGAEQQWWIARDREDELASVARRIKARERPPLDRLAIVCKRPLPYVYLAQSHLDAAGLPFQAFDELPLAAEPFAAAVDLVFRAIESGFAPRALLALLRSPHFRLVEPEISAASLAALERLLRETTGCRDVSGLEDVAARWSGPEARPVERSAAPAAAACASLARRLAPLAAMQSASQQFGRLLAFLESRGGRVGDDEAIGQRTARARSAIIAAVRQLAEAHAAHDDPRSTFSDLVARLRRWMEAQTFSPRTGSGGLHLLDAEAARYGDFEEAFLVGLIEREWPEPSARPIFYPMSLLAHLGWPSERARLAAARATFADLVRLPASRLSASTFLLEDDALVEPSPLLDELTRAPLLVAAEEPVSLRVLPDEALTLDPVRADVLPDRTRAWVELRQARSPHSSPAFHGIVGPTHVGTPAVRRLETYLDCPFRYFAEGVLGLKDESDEDPGEGPRADGQFLHEVLAAFYADWHARGGREITAANLDAARQQFAALVERRLAGMSASAAALWRARLLGCAARTGIVELALRFEAARTERVEERLLEHRFDGPCQVTAGDATRRIALRGVADRIDLLEGGRFRLIDYKLGRAPDVARAIQLPVYAVQASQQLGTADQPLVAHDAGYLAFGEREPYVRLAPPGQAVAQAVAHGQERLLSAVSGIEQGVFPPRPADTILCTYCPFSAVCRKDYANGE